LKIRGYIRRSRSTTGINDTGGKFCHQFRYVDTGGKFAAGVNDTDGKFNFNEVAPKLLSDIFF
jgi:hypothetical protein